MKPTITAGAFALVLACCAVYAADQPKLTAVVRSGELVWSESYSPRFSPDGRSLAYVQETHLGYDRSQRALWVLDLGTMKANSASGQTDGIDPAWSADGALLAFIEPTRTGDVHGRLSAIEAGGFRKRPLAADDDAYNPAFVRDANKVAFLRHKEAEGGVATVLCTVAPDATGYEEVHSWPFIEPPGDLQWCHSGHKIAYWIRTRAVEQAEGVPTRKLALRVFDIDTKKDTDLPLPEGTRYVGQMRWSPDDGRIAFEATFEKNQTEIWAVPAAAGSARDDGQPKRITLGARGENFYNPTWALFGNGIVCVRHPRADDDKERSLPELVLVDLATRKQYPLEPDWSRPVDPAADIEMEASPDGRMVVVAAEADLRFLELGSEADRNKNLAADNIRKVARALVRYAVERGGNQMPAPRKVGNTTEGADFWVERIKDIVTPAALHSPGDPDTKSPSSYKYPETAYNLDARLISPQRDKVILIEKSGIHPGGHHEAKMNGQVVWVPDAPAAQR